MAPFTHGDYSYADEGPPLDDRSPSNTAGSSNPKTTYYTLTSLSATKEEDPSMGESESESESEVNLGEDTALHLAATSSSKKRKKKPHHVPKKYRIKRGRLSLTGLLELPRDIFFEIAIYFQPRDLLHLARSSKQLRAALMSKSAQPIWVQSRKNLPSFEEFFSDDPFTFPECPSDLSEPAYASLVFDTDCLKCGAKAEFTNYHYRLRVCKVCFRGHVGLAPSRGDISLFRSLLEAQGVEPRGGESGDAELELIRSLVLESAGQIPQFFGPTALSVYQQCMAFRARMKPYDYECYLLLRQKDMGGIKLHAFLLNGWNKLYLGIRKRGLQNHLGSLSEKRSSEITRRLIDMGYLAQDFPKTPKEARAESHDQDDAYNKTTYQAWRMLVLVASPLSEHGEIGWDNIKPILEMMLSSNKVRRLAREGGRSLIRRSK